jgi:hypothetical protein
MQRYYSNGACSIALKKGGEPSRVRERAPPNIANRQLLTPIGTTPKLYSDVAAGHNENKFKLAISTKGTHTPDEIKNILKEKVKLTEIKVGIQSLRPLRD